MKHGFTHIIYAERDTDIGTSVDDFCKMTQKYESSFGVEQFIRENVSGTFVASSIDHKEAEARRFCEFWWPSGRTGNGESVEAREEKCWNKFVYVHITGFARNQYIFWLAAKFDCIVTH